MKEITIQRAWLEGLLEYAQETEKYIVESTPKERLFLLKYKIHNLLGYVSSAETILKP